MICSNCNVNNIETAKFCYSCGKKLGNNTKAVPVPENRNTEMLGDASSDEKTIYTKKVDIPKTSFSYKSRDFAYLHLVSISCDDIYIFEGIDGKARVKVPGDIVRANIQNPAIGKYYWAVLENLHHTRNGKNYFSRAYFKNRNNSSSKAAHLTFFENHQNDRYVPVVIGKCDSDGIRLHIGPNAYFKCKVPENFDLKKDDVGLFRVDHIEREESIISASFSWCNDSKELDEENIKQLEYTSKNIDTYKRMKTQVLKPIIDMHVDDQELITPTVQLRKQNTQVAEIPVACQEKNSFTKKFLDFFQNSGNFLRNRHN